MNCCEKCFTDVELRNRISVLNKKGNCDYCGAEDVNIYDVELDEQNMAEDFLELLDIYKHSSLLESKYPDEKLVSIPAELSSTWKIFSSEIVAEKIIKDLCQSFYDEFPEVIDEMSGIPELCDETYLNDYAVLKIFSWSDFTKSIKENNRFHTNHINESILEIFCSERKIYKADEFLYRARISNHEMLTEKQMGAPKPRQATSGRANPEGISCLYLTSDVDTALNEVRAGVHDIVYVGKFIAKKDIEVVDLKNIDRLSPFGNIDKTLHAVNRKSLARIANEIARPLRRNDSPLDYLPTQYISDFIKSKGHSGIEYKSTMSSDGYNVAVFDESDYECIGVVAYEIKSLEYAYEELTDDTQLRD
ncbi:MAG: RES family NAD+ phosphorylase [Clostridiales Family XIII bacterium]|jgi:hypothetical protein|nr:RES family NAD+ phosphorylase [Clostridiales Family XIII bacterium]